MNAKLKDNQILIQDDDNNSYVVDVLFTYNNDVRNKDYVFFVNPDNEEEILVFAYNDKGELFDIEDDEEFKEAEEVLNAYEEEIAA